MGAVTARGREALEAAAARQDEVVGFLRELIAIPAESLSEGDRCRRVLAEYERLGFDEVRIDGLGNVIARIGSGPVTVLMDGHIDCVGVGDPTAWDHDPFEGKLEDGKVWGRGAVDELPAAACMAYGMAIARERGLPEELTVVLCSSVMEEDCDGFCLLHVIENEGISPDLVVIGEPTNLGVYRGQRGRVEAVISTRGVSSHAAHPEEGVNALYQLAPILRDIELLNDRLPGDDFLGKGTVVASYVECDSASLNAVPAAARLYIDRRLTVGETPEAALEEIRSLPSIAETEATVELLEYDETSWTGARARQDKIFPAWVLPEDHPLVSGVAGTVAEVTGHAPVISRWGFSTNGVATMGRNGIPSVGFAPGLEELAHTTEEWVAISDLVTATAVYSLLPETLAPLARDLKGG
ncbi:MAG: YgeY family selenium metabolism-linked hydrolase [marine benthic group bacterium]|nr:YgeY family selenium metabolism-linked hydrolase [Candidatus Benthicola marisminoris]